MSPFRLRSLAGHPDSQPCQNNENITRFRALPPHINKLGEAVLGSRAELQKLIRQIQRPRAVRIADGRCIFLVMHPQDNSVPRLVKEVPQDEYHLRRLRGGTKHFMVDIGANLGDQSIAATLWNPAMQVLAIEPVPLTHFFFVWNLHLNRVPILELSDLAANGAHRPGVVPLNGALAGDGAPPSVTLRWSMRQSQDAAVDMSAHGGTAPGGAGRKWRTSQVAAVHLPSLLRRASAPTPITLLKLDCEGCEYTFAASSGEWLKDRRNVVRIAGERHPFLGVLNRSRETLASKVPIDVARAAERVFQARGCSGPRRQRLDC